MDNLTSPTDADTFIILSRDHFGRIYPAKFPAESYLDSAIQLLNNGFTYSEGVWPEENMRFVILTPTPVPDLKNYLAKFSSTY